MLNSMKQKDMKKTDLSKYTHKEGLSIKKVLWYFVSTLFFTNRLFPLSFLKVFLLRLFGAKIGEGIFIKPQVNIKYPWKLSIGNYTWIGEGVFIDNLAKVEIGDNCCISQGAMLLTGNHNYKKTSFDLITKSIALKEGVWIGARAIVCPGVICGSHSVLTLGSVAVKNMEPYSIYQGDPAIFTKKRIIE